MPPLWKFYDLQVRLHIQRVSVVFLRGSRTSERESFVRVMLLTDEELMLCWLKQ